MRSLFAERPRHFLHFREIFCTHIPSQKHHLQIFHPCLTLLSRALHVLDAEYDFPSALMTSCLAPPLPSLISPRNSVPFIPNLTRSLYHLLLCQSRCHRRYQHRILSSIRNPTNLGYSAGISDTRRTIQNLKTHWTRSVTPQHSPRQIRRPLRMQRQWNPGMPHSPTWSLRL